MRLWPKVKHLFEKDDGSLPDIYVEGISPDQTIALYEWLMEQCEIYGSPTLWSIEKQLDIPIREIPQVARAFFQGRVESFRHGIVGLAIRDVLLPALSVCVDSDGLSLDFRKGAEWDEQKVAALFDLLLQFREKAPQANIKQCDEGSYLNPNEEFAEALKLYASQSGC
jgi:hypothetical protein